MRNTLFYGDNLEVLRNRIGDESVDLIYLDPPFNSNQSYNVLFREKSGVSATAQLQAFEDTWTWDQAAVDAYEETIKYGSPSVSNIVRALHSALGENDLMAYLVMMAPRLVELHRVLKPTGSLYLHCDPTASHYLKLLLDAVFGAAAFLNEVIWKRTSSHNSSRRYGPIHDVILYYGKGERPTWADHRIPYDREYLERNFTYQDENGRRYSSGDITGAGIRNGQSGQPWRGIDVRAKGRHWAYLPDALEAMDNAGKIHWPKAVGGMPRIKQYADEMRGMSMQDIWLDLPPIGSQAAERLGYPTQKPIALLERIIQASSNPGDVVLDPFCGCGTAVAAAEQLGRQWLGIDVTYIAVDLIDKRLVHTYGDEIRKTYDIDGIPFDVRSAEALFQKSPFDFQRWAVSLVGGTPNERLSGDRGIDGVIRFEIDSTVIGESIVSVKGGRAGSPGDVRDLVGTVTNEDKEMGVFISLKQPTRDMLAAALSAGQYVLPRSGTRFQRVQALSVPELLSGKKPHMPYTLLPYFKARGGGRERQARLM